MWICQTQYVAISSSVVAIRAQNKPRWDWSRPPDSHFPPLHIPSSSLTPPPIPSLVTPPQRISSIITNLTTVLCFTLNKRDFGNMGFLRQQQVFINLIQSKVWSWFINQPKPRANVVVHSIRSFEAIGLKWGVTSGFSLSPRVDSGSLSTRPFVWTE